QGQSKRQKMGPRRAVIGRVQALLGGATHPIYKGSQSGEEPMFRSKRRGSGWGFALAFLGVLSVLATAADARVGGGRGFGSRGSRTYSSPPSTNTAPRVAPVEKSFTQPGNQTATQASGASRFGGWRSILLGGLFAGILASIFGFGVLASVLGFLLQ